jgi:3-dehydrotetronate 4-kinase
VAFVRSAGPRCLVTTSATAATVREAQATFGGDRVATAIESVLAAVAIGAVDMLGVRRLLIAGGETSGAVTSALGVESLIIGPQVSPGLPWAVCEAQTGSTPALALLLKSGNFGAANLFTTAWEACA